MQTVIHAGQLIVGDGSEPIRDGAVVVNRAIARALRGPSELDGGRLGRRT